MTKKQVLIGFGVAMGVALFVPLIAGETSGIGPEVRAYPDRLRRAEELGLDLGHHRRIAREAARPAEKRREFDRLETFLRTPDLFAMPKPPSPMAPINPAGVMPTGHPSLRITPNTKPARTDAELRANLRELAVLSRAAEGGSHYDWAQGFGLLFPTYAPIKSGARAASHLALVDGRRGSYAQATEALLNSSEAWRVYGDDPILIADLVRTATLSLLFRGAGTLLARPTYPPSEARRLLAMAEGPAFAPRSSMRDTLVLETSTLVTDLDDPKLLDGDDDWSRMNPNEKEFRVGMKMPQVRTAWKSDALRLMNATVSRLPTDPYDFDRAEREMKAYDVAAAVPRGVKGRASAVLGGVYSYAVISQRRREAIRRVLIVAAALRAGESEKRLRTRLGRLAVDPYDGRPIRIRPAREIPVWLKEAIPGLSLSSLRAVYSIGPNLSDDGGLTTKKNEEGDIVLVIPR